MKTINTPLKALRKAVRLSPDNVPLRQHFADTLLVNGLTEEAEREFRATLALDPDNEKIKLGLASAFLQQGKKTAALVVLEDLIQSDEVPPRAFILHARLLLKTGEKDKAVEEYKRALQLDPGLADPTFAEQLGYLPQEYEIEDEDFDDDFLPAPSEYPEEEGLGLELERPDLDFNDVGGMETAKDEIRMKIIHPLARPDLFQVYGKKVGGGILLYGPPGCGKTHMARATAGEVRSAFISVGIHNVLDMWIGTSERNLHDIFEHAREHTPCILFFDEVDALGASRADMRRSGARQLVNQFQFELDGVNPSNEGILILAATNAPWHLDPAFRRTGRFDRILFVPPPDLQTRTQILRIHLKSKPARDIDFEYLAQKTSGFSGSDLKTLVDIAVDAKLRMAIESGTPEPLTNKDLQDALLHVVPSTSSWFRTAGQYAAKAGGDEFYNEILAYMKEHNID